MGRAGCGGVKTVTLAGEFSYERVEAAPPAAEELAAYAGRYYSPELDVEWTIEAGDCDLRVRRHKYVDSRMAPVFCDVFRDDRQPIMGYPTSCLVVFQRDARGAVAGLRVSGSRVRHMWLVKWVERKNPL